MSARVFEIGIYTFGDIIPNPLTGEALTPAQKMRDVVKMAKLADEVELDVFAVGEHHRLDMVVSSPPVVLAAAAEATRNIRLSSATTVLNTLDPVRVFEDFATLDLLSGGRAEIIAGRGSFTENFELFGYKLEDYDALFAEKLDLLLKLNAQPVVSWEGRLRPPLRDAEIAPRPARPLPIWLGMGGTPQSAVRAGALGLPLNIAILGGPERFVPFTQIYRQAAQQAGHDAAHMRIAISSHGHLGDDAQQARDEHFALYAPLMRQGLRNRFRGIEITREQYDQEVGPRGAMFVGNAEDAIQKILWERSIFRHDRVMLQLDWGALPFAKVARSIEILGTQVAPAVRDALR